MSVIVNLVENGTNIDIKGHKDGETALIKAAQHGWLNIVQYLIAHGASIDQQDNQGATALFRAVTNGQIHILQYLLEQKADFNLTCSRVPPLLIAIKARQTECARLLMQYGMRLNEENSKLNIQLSIDLIFTTPNFDDNHRDMMSTLLSEYGLSTYQNAYAQDQKIESARNAVHQALEKLSGKPEVQQTLLKVAQGVLDIVKIKPVLEEFPGVIIDDSTDQPQQHDNIHKPVMKLN